MLRKPQYTYLNPELIKIVDGDTFDFAVKESMDMGFHVVVEGTATPRFRMRNFDAPESRAPKGGDNERLHAVMAKWMANQIIRVIGVESLTSYKEVEYNRWAADLTLRDGRDFVHAMTAAGMHKRTPEDYRSGAWELGIDATLLEAARNAALQ